MTTPTPLTDAEIALLLGRHYMYESEKVRAIEAEVNRRWLKMLAEQEPVGKFGQFTDGIWREVTAGSAGIPLYKTLNAESAEPAKMRPDFMAGYDAGMADAKRMANQVEPVAIVVDAYDTPGLQWLCQNPPSNGCRLYSSPIQQAEKDVNSTHTLAAKMPNGATASNVYEAYDIGWQAGIDFVNKWKNKSFSEVHPANPDAKCKCEHWESCAECHPTAHPAPSVSTKPVAWAVYQGRVHRVLVELTNNPARAHNWKSSLCEVVDLYAQPTEQIKAEAQGCELNSRPLAWIGGNCGTSFTQSLERAEKWKRKGLECVPLYRKAEK